MPKIESVGDVRQVVRTLKGVKVRGPRPPLHVILESISGIEDAEKIALLPEVRCLEFGIMDFVSSVDGAIPAAAMQSPGQFRHQILRLMKAKIVLAALRAGKVAAHNVTIRFADQGQTFQDAYTARTEFGFLRMWSIHPDQIRPILQAMAPPADELERASRVLVAGQEADWGPVRVDAELYDRASYRYFWSLVQRARVLPGGVPAALEERFFS